MAARQKMKATDVSISCPTPAAPAAPAPSEEATPAPASAVDPEMRFTGGFITVATRDVPASPAATQEGSATRHQRAELRRLRLLSASQLRRTSDLGPLVRDSLWAKLAQPTPSRLAASAPPPPSSQEEAIATEKRPELVKEKELKSRASRAARRPALIQLSCNTSAAATRSVRRSRRISSLLGDPGAPNPDVSLLKVSK